MKSIPRAMRSFGRVAFLSLALLFTTTTNAHAYVDPGTGAMILQIIGAVVAGLLFYFRQLRQWIAALFNRLVARSPPKEEKP